VAQPFEVKDIELPVSFGLDGSLIAVQARDLRSDLPFVDIVGGMFSLCEGSMGTEKASLGRGGSGEPDYVCQ
jgi:hypothetical protein